MGEVPKAGHLARVVTAIFLCMIGSFVMISSAFGQTTTRGPWEVRFEIATRIGVDLDEGTKLDLAVGSEEILFSGEAGFLVPIAQVIEVTYDNTARSRMNLWEQLAGDIVTGGILWPFAVGLHVVTYGVLSFFKAEDHYINVLWREDETIREIVFESGKNDYQPILQAIQSASGHEWKDLPAQRETLQRELESETKRSLSIELDRRVRFGQVLLSPGPYQLVILEREVDAGELYFFAGDKVEPKEVAHAVPVEVIRLAISATATEIVYGQMSGVASIDEIHVGEFIFRIRR